MKTTAIIYTPLQHRGRSRILVQFAHHKTWNERIRKVPGAQWSSTLKGWHIPDTPENRKKCGLAPATDLAVVQQKVQSSRLQFSANNKEQLLLFLEKLALKKYSRSTLQTYRNEFCQLLQKLGDVPVQDLTPDHLKRYMLYCVTQLKLSENTLHSRLNALKFYYEQVLHREKFFWEIPRPKKQLQLPKVLNETEIGRLFKVISNLKHKAIVFTAYSAGLRVSEVVSLKLSDVDSKRMALFIQQAKGKKDRYVNLSPVLLDILRSYLKKQNPRPKHYLFEGQVPGEPYSVRSAQQIFIYAKKAAGISKSITFHGLRHSFATHLLEKGVDIKYIKDILGHFDIKTTERYVHVARKKLVNITSPLDDLHEKGIL
ncbi:MAG: tyrosine-type recombinase/integrase [Lacibacter sp.]|jgi:site-specific recombinase XerD